MWFVVGLNVALIWQLIGFSVALDLVDVALDLVGVALDLVDVALDWVKCQTA